jgi:hypothetical protein
MKIIFLCCSLLCLLIAPTIARSTESIPNANLKVTVQQREDGKINAGFHIFELSCWEGKCSLSSVSLNQCFDFGSGKKAFYPKAQYSATWLGNMKVSNEGKTIVVQETGSDAFGEYVNNFRFEYQAVARGDVANRLVGFSGGYIKNSGLLRKVITMEYVPLQKADQIMKLDCDVLLPGVDKQR